MISMSPLLRLCFPKRAAEEDRLRPAIEDLKRMLYGDQGHDPDRIVADVNRAVSRRRFRSVIWLGLVLLTVGAVTFTMGSMGCCSTSPGAAAGR